MFAVILFFISISPKNPSIIVFYDALITVSFATMIVVLPIILLSVAFFMKKGRKQYEKNLLYHHQFLYSPYFFRLLGSRFIKKCQITFFSCGKLLGSFVIHDQPRGEQSEGSDDVLYSIGSTLREARDKVDSKLANFMRAYKNRVLFIGEERAKQDIIDVFYRDPKSALNAKISIAKGKVSQLLFKKKIGNVQISEEIANLITSSKQSTFVTKADIQSICPVMLDLGEDFLLPYISKKDIV
ncbi:hypothetical protein [Shimazuella alba]|uniref:Spore germination protein N-terminal domain-containing protein n=1 Tax=Shimazuella alba TaxID=2690964 RepID=A0A6I4VW21_9BACL|nr:hypothetical protein [Shimazuella alba]MXQ54295.1 hypothetical protein [Shimazuella alba]